ncbi:MAG: aldehyde:ferredoxin oxidoreductase [Clostridia bacterium]|nr:aldehyde:ferredoxin oxidoreductase [Clostridia bacterium]
MATNYGAYTGKVLKIDLTKREHSEYPLSDKDRKLFLGGKILAARILNDFITKPIDPLGEENVLVVSTGPLTGTGCPSSSRFNVSAVSPLTGLLTSSNCGGGFGLALKRAGYDALIITGKSNELLQIDITDSAITYKNADHLKNMLTGEVQQAIGGRSSKLVIGPAGENLVKYACAISDDRAAGRGGIGAVMGSKKIKAITAFGAQVQAPFNKEKLNIIKKKWTMMLKKHPLTGEQLPKLGTAALLSAMQQKSLLATKNFSAGKFDGYRSISGEALAEKYLIKNRGCLTCPIQCARVVEVDGKQVKGPEVEVMGLLGANILNDNLQDIIKWNYELDELGMDTISTAGTIAFAMELNEKGMWKSGLTFGKTDNISETIKKIAFREGEIGDAMADGSKALMKKFGGEEFCMQVKGMELAAYEPRGAVGQGLGYSVGNRGGCHINAGYVVVIEGLGLTINPYTTAGKAQLSIMFQNLMEAVSAGGNCLFTTYAFFPPFLFRKPNSVISRLVNAVLPFTGPFIGIANKLPGILKVNIPFMLPHTVAIKAATGIKMNMGELMKIGARGFNLERMINNRLGVTRADDKLPARLTEVNQIEGNNKSKVPQEKLRKQYYKARGWNSEGGLNKFTKRYYGLDKLDNISERK